MRQILYLGFLIAMAAPAEPQEAASGFSVPVTLSGNLRYERASDVDGSKYGETNAGFRALISPSLRLGQHWFAYGVVDTRSKNFLDYPAGEEQAVRARLTQAYIGYKVDKGPLSFLFKAGRLNTAFGHYPLQYDDAKSPFIAPPAIYTGTLLLRPDQVPCDLGDILQQGYGGEIQFGCGGATGERYGISPVTLYGIPGVEAQVSWNGFDGRLQLTNSSPANPQSLLSQSQRVQWTAGGGYTFSGGLHIGVSGFRGPYLERAVEPYLVGTSIGDFPTSGFGVEAQWARGPWALEGEWQRFHFASPAVPSGVSEQGGYAQVKRILSPRFFLAARANVIRSGGATTSSGRSIWQIDSNMESEEVLLGWNVSRWQLIKVGVERADRNSWQSQEYWPGQRSIGLEIQVVFFNFGPSKTLQ